MQVRLLPCMLMVQVQGQAERTHIKLGALACQLCCKSLSQLCSHPELAFSGL